MQQIEETERLITVYRNANEVIVGTQDRVYSGRGLAFPEPRIDTREVGRRLSLAVRSRLFTCVTDGEADAVAADCLCCQPTVRSADRRITRELSRRGMLAGAAGGVAALRFGPRAGGPATPGRPPA